MLTLKPAYGRDYKTAEEVRRAFDEGKDFLVAVCGKFGCYANKEDIKGKHIKIRFNKLEDFTIIHGEA